MAIKPDLNVRVCSIIYQHSNSRIFYVCGWDDAIVDVMRKMHLSVYIDNYLVPPYFNRLCMSRHRLDTVFRLRQKASALAKLRAWLLRRPKFETRYYGG